MISITKAIMTIAALFMLTGTADAQTLTGPKGNISAPAQTEQASPSPTPTQTNTPQAAPSQTPATSSEQPLEISADQTLEWHRADQRFIARGNALAVQTPSSLAAQTLTADYENAEGENSGMTITHITAEEDVVIESDGSKAYGDQANYDLKKGLAIMTGDDLRMISPDQTVTARDRFEYHVEDGRLNAIGDAVVIRPNQNGGQDKLTADTASAVFGQNAQGERVLKILEANNNVVITTPTEKITGNYGIYRAETNKAEITGNVILTRGPNILKGERAVVDLNTNISTLYAAPNANAAPKGRVTGVFYPGSE